MKQCRRWAVEVQRLGRVTTLAAVGLLLLACGEMGGGPGASGSLPAVPAAPTPVPVEPSPTPATERVDLTIRKATLRTAAPNQTELVVDLSIPDACTEARYEVSREGQRVRVQVWGERPVGVLCAQVVREEQLVVPLGFAVSGGFIVELNGVEVTPGEGENVKGEPGSGALEYGPAFVEQVEVRVGEGAARRVVVEVRGSLPDACSELASEPAITIVGHRITIMLEWERPRELVCAQVLRPFSTAVDLGELQPGSYTLVVNDLETTFTVE
ncbi:MAG: hypothetical protein NZL87_07980 [Thermomicrobium sp.]|nr:hypothetical protein [Thermomicrobium sp.]